MRRPIKRTFKRPVSEKDDKQPRTSWNHVAKQYNKIVENSGHYYHEHVVIPGVLRLLELNKDSVLLDLASGQGVLARAIPKEVEYHGVEVAPALIEKGRQKDKNPRHHYHRADITGPMSLPKLPFTHATIILALQNVMEPKAVLNNTAKYLQPGGTFVIVINHPAFRIPRQSAWEIDKENKMEYRRINRYMGQLKIPINMEPGRGRSGKLTWSFHFPLASLSQWLLDTGFYIKKIEEWTSDKTSEGAAAKMENRARDEFPLFMTVVAVKR